MGEEQPIRCESKSVDERARQKDCKASVSQLSRDCEFRTRRPPQAPSLRDVVQVGRSIINKKLGSDEVVVDNKALGEEGVESIYN